MSLECSTCSIGADKCSFFSIFLKSSRTFGSAIASDISMAEISAFPLCYRFLQIGKALKQKTEANMRCIQFGAGMLKMLAKLKIWKELRPQPPQVISTV